MNSNRASRVHTAWRWKVLTKGVFLAGMVFVLLAALLLGSAGRAHAEDEYVTFNRIRVEFDDDNNAAGLRPASGSNTFQLYYTSSGYNYSTSYTLNASSNWETTIGTYSNVRINSVSLSTSSNNWQYYRQTGYHVDDNRTLIATYEKIPAVEDLDITVHWSDNGNADDIRPETANFVPTLRLGSSMSSTGSVITPENFTVTDNGDDTWTLHFTGLSIQPANNANRYLCLTWLDNSQNSQKYFNQATNNNSSNSLGYMAVDLSVDGAKEVTTIATTDRTLTATLTWDDNSDRFGKRPTPADFKPTLLLSNSYNYATSGYVKPVTISENGYTITDNGNNTWTINFTDVNVKELYSESSSYRYLWLTWEGSDYYANQTLNNKGFGYTYSNIATSSTASWTTRSSIVNLKLTWQDESDAHDTRPSVEEFRSSVKLMLSNSTTSIANARDVTGNDYTITDNGDNTWSLTFIDTTARQQQTTSGSWRYLVLTWQKDGNYVNETTTGYMVGNVHYVDAASYSSASSTLPYTAVPNYLTLTINWNDNKDEFGTRPDPETFVPKLYLSSAYSTGSSLTSENSVDVTGTNYTITPSADNSSWTILLKDTTARARQNSSMRYLWFTWEGGNHRYLNEDKTNYSAFSANSGLYPYRDLLNNSSPSFSYTMLPRYVPVTLTWKDNSDALGRRPTPETFVPKLYLGSTSAANTDLAVDTGSDRLIRDNGDNTWTIVFWDTDIRTKAISNSNSRYLWFTWSGADVYANDAKTNQELGYSYGDLYGLTGSGKFAFNAITKYLQIKLNWSDDNNNVAGSRPLPENFKPYLYGTANVQTIPSDSLPLGSNWDIHDNGDGTWILTLLDADSSAVRGNYYYFWLNWEDTSLGDKPQRYFNDVRNVSDYGGSNSRARATTETPIFYPYSKAFRIRVYWEDSSNVLGLRPNPEDLKFHLWINTSNSAGDDVDYGGENWNVIDNGDNTWDVYFLDSELYKQLSYNNYYTWMTFDGPGDDCYIHDLKTGTNYGSGYVRRNSNSFNKLQQDSRRWTDWNTRFYPLAIQTTLEWHDNEDAFGHRPDPEDFVPHLWLINSTSNAESAEEVTGNYEITDNGDGTWTILFKNSPARQKIGTNSSYLWLTWEGSDQYYNTAKKSADYGATYQRLYNQSSEELVFIARQKPFQILLKWEDGDNFLGYRPDPSEFTPHVWRANGNDGNKVEITGSNWTVTDNGDNTWMLTFPEPENLTGVTADQTYIRLTWEGSDQYYNNVKDTTFGYMRDLFTNDDPYYVLTTRARQRELPLVLNWDDYSNGRGTRPDPTAFTPHLWYRASNYNGSSVSTLVEIADLERDVDYQILTDEDAQNRWTIRFLSIPYQYLRQNSSGVTELANISEYILTWDGSDEYYNQVLDGSFGYMSVAANSYSPSVTTRLKDRSLDLKLTWSDYSDEGGYRPTPEEFTPQLYSGSNVRTNVPIELEDGSWTITDNGDNTWLIHFDNVPYAVATTSGSTNTYGYYWLTWTGSDEYWNQRTSTSSTSYTTGVMRFDRTSANPSVTTYLKTRSRLIRLYWQDSQNANGWRPTPDELLANMHLWAGSSTATVEIPMDSVTVTMQDNESSPNYWDIRIDYLPYYYDNGSYITTYSYYWLTWDGDHYINQVKTTVTPGAMYFQCSTSDRTQINCYPDEIAQTTLYVYWYDNHNADGTRPTPEEYKFQIYYGTDRMVEGELPSSEYEWEYVDTSYTNGEYDRWEIRITGLPRSYVAEDGTETSFTYYWLGNADSTSDYASNVLRYGNNGYFTGRASNGASTLYQYNYLNHRKDVTVTLTWDDRSNADGLRPAPEDFVPHLGYSEYNITSRQLGVFSGVDYEITDNGNNTWTITFKDVPLVFSYDNGVQEPVWYYWFTCDSVDGYTEINNYNTNNYSIAGSVSTSSRTNSYTTTAKLSRVAEKNIKVTLNWQDNANAWGRRPTASSFVPHLWAGTDSEAKREIPLTSDQWELTDAGSTSSTWTLMLKNVESLPAGSYWLTWDGSDDYYNQLTKYHLTGTSTTSAGCMYWSYSNASPSVYVYPRKMTSTLYWQDGSDIDGKRPDPDTWIPILHYGTSSAAMGEAPLSGNGWHVVSTSASQWVVEFYGFPDKYTDDHGNTKDIGYYWLTFDTQDGYYLSDRENSGFGAMSWPWYAGNSNYGMNVYTNERPLTITLTWSDNDGQVGERPEPTPESLGAHLWYGTSDEALGEIPDLNYTVTDNGDNTWTLVFDSVPGYYRNANGTDTAIQYYWLTYDGGRHFLNNLRNTFSGSHGVMRSSVSSTNNYNMTTYCDYERIGVNVQWLMTGNIANVTSAEIDHSHVLYDLVDTETGEVLATWEPASPNNASYSNTFFVPRYDDEGHTVDHRRYTVVQRGTPGVFDVDYTSTNYTSGVPGHQVNIANTAQEKFYRFNFTFNDDGNALKLRPTTLNYLASEVGGNTYTYRGSVSNISSTQDSYSTPIITLLGRDIMTAEELDYELELTNLGKYYDVEFTERLDDNGVINFDYTLTLKTQPVTLQVVWDDENNEEHWRPASVQEYLLANGVKMFPDNLLTFNTDDALPDDPNVWQKQMVLPTVDADGNPITWKLKQVPAEALRIYHAEQEAVQEPDFGGQTVTLTNMKQDNWNYAIDLYWVGYAKGSYSGNTPATDVSNRYDIYETVPLNDDMRTYKYELNISVNSAHYDVGDLEVRLPYYMMAMTTNGATRWVSPANPTNDISVPMAPLHNDRYSFNYYIDDHGTSDKSDDEIVFVNWEELTASSNTKIQVIYTLYPDEHLDTHIYELQAHGTGYAILTDEQGETHKEELPEEQTSNTITFGMDTGLDVRSFTKRYTSPQLLHYYNTSYIDQSHLSRDAFDTENFDYVAYGVSFTVYANQYSKFTLTDLPGQNGEIVSVKSFSSSDYGLSLSGPTFSADKRVWTYTANPYHGYSNPYSTRYYYVVVAYPKTEGNIILEDGRIFTRYTNEADVAGVAQHTQNPDNLTPPPTDLNDTDEMNDATFIEWGDYRWKPSGKIFYYDKALQRNFVSSNTSVASGGQTMLDYDADIDASFRVEFFVNGDELMLDGVHEYYRFNITDNELWLNGTVNGVQTDYVKLEPGDYEITSISVSATARYTDHTTGEPFPNPPQGTFVIQGQVGETGEWENITTYRWPAGSTSQGQSFSASGLAGRGYTGFRVKTPDRVNQFVDITATFTVKLMAKSPKVKALLQEGERLTQVQMLNIAAFPMEIEEPDGSWSMFTDIHREYNGAVAPGVPSHTDNMAVLVGLYGNDPDRLDYGDEVELIYDHALAQAIPITSSVTMGKNTDSVLGNSLTEIVKAQFTLNAAQTISNTLVPMWLQEMIEIKEGYFYDLLPEGWSIDPTETVLVSRYSTRTGTGPASLVGEPEVIDNYKGTNRQMIIFHVKSEGDSVNYYSGSSGFKITFGAVISYEDVSLYPRGTNVAVFQGIEYDEDGKLLYDDNGNYIPQVWELMHTNTTAYYDDGDYGNSVYSILDENGRRALEDINGDGVTNQNDVLYMNSVVAPNFAKSVQTGVDKLIMGKSGVWQLHDITDLDTDYKYYLGYTTTGNGTSSNVIIYDVLENAANTRGHTGEKYWKGTFVDIDVSNCRAMGIDAKVYYSTATNLDENNNFFGKDSSGNPLPPSQIQMSIDDRPDLWIRYDSATAPKDRITAIAVDLRKRTDGTDMVFDGYENSQTSFVITMHSPDELPEDPEAILAYNRPCYQTNLNSGGEDTPFFNINDRVTIELHDLKTLRFRKITRSDPIPGEDGTVTNGAFTYEEMPLPSVYFHLYQLTCTNESHTDLSKHSAPPYTTSATGGNSNSCWTRISVVQTQSDGIAEFKDLETGTYAIREYNPYTAGSDTDSTTYVLTQRNRLRNMWWSVDVDARSRQEPVITYRGTNYDSSFYEDVVWHVWDQNIGGITETDITRTVMNVRIYQALEIQKRWWDKSGDNRPDSIKVNILRNGVIYIRDVELKASENWHTWIFDLPVTSAYGTRYHYTVQETQETLAALQEAGYNVVVDNNNYTSLSGPNTITFNDTRRENIFYQQRRLHNSTDDRLVIGKKVAAGGDLEKKYQFSQRLTDMDDQHTVLSGSYDYSLYRYDEESGTWVWVENNTFTLDANGTWGNLKLAHNERVVIYGLPIGTNYVLTEVGADGYVQSTTRGSLSGSVRPSNDTEEAEDMETNLVEVTNTYATQGRANVTADKTINGRRPVYFTTRTFDYYLKEVEWGQYDTSEGAEEGALIEGAEDAIKVYRLNGNNKVTINFSENSGKGYKVNNAGSGDITFPTLQWESGISGYRGYRVYTVREVYMVPDPETGELKPDRVFAGYEDGMDTTVYVVWVELRDNQTGMLETRISYYKLPEDVYEANVSEKDSWLPLTGLSDFHFNNIYNADGDLRIRLKKTINGVEPDSKPFKRKTFQYTLTYQKADGPVTQTAKNDGTGWADFDLGQFMGDTEDEQMFTIDDVGSNQFFRYTLTENVLDETGVTIDSVEYAITIQITDQGAGRLGAKADIVATRNGTRVTMPTVTISRLPRRGDSAYDTDLQTMLAALSQKLTFNNIYEASGQWQPRVRKLINGVLIDTEHYKNHTFSFAMKDSQGRVIGTTENGADGTGLFPAVLYTQDDIGNTYTYTIIETGTAGDGVTTLDNTSWEIDVRIDDLGEGQLQPVVTQVRKDGTSIWSIEDETLAPDACEFDNPYEATGSVKVEATKKMTGRDLFAGEFSFRILDENVLDENGQPTVVAIGTNDQDGNVTFSEISYTLDDVGTHEYTVVEVKGDTAGVVYDELSWTVITTVTDNGDGTLDVSYVTVSRGD